MEAYNLATRYINVTIQQSFNESPVFLVPNTQRDEALSRDFLAFVI